MSSSFFTADDFVHSRASSQDFKPLDEAVNMTPLRGRSDDDTHWQPQKTNNFFGTEDTGMGPYGNLAALAMRNMASVSNAPARLGAFQRTLHRLLGLPSLQHLSAVDPSFLLQRIGQLLFPYMTHFKPMERSPIPSVAFEPLSPIERGDLKPLSPEADAFIPSVSLLLLRCINALASKKMAGLALGVIPFRLLLLLSSKMFGISGVGDEGGMTIGETIVLLSTSALHCCLGLIVSYSLPKVFKIIIICYLAISWSVFEVKLLRQRLSIIRENEMRKLIFLFIYGIGEALLLMFWVWIL